MHHPELIRISDVCAQTGRKKTSIYNLIGKNLFPKPLRFGPRMARWPRHEVDGVLAAMIRGASDDEIRELVVELAEQRATFGASTLANAQ